MKGRISRVRPPPIGSHKSSIEKGEYKRHFHCRGKKKILLTIETPYSRQTSLHLLLIESYLLCIFADAGHNRRSEQIILSPSLSFYFSPFLCLPPFLPLFISVVQHPNQFCSSCSIFLSISISLSPRLFHPKPKPG